VSSEEIEDDLLVEATGRFTREAKQTDDMTIVMIPV